MSLGKSDFTPLLLSSFGLRSHLSSKLLLSSTAHACRRTLQKDSTRQIHHRAVILEHFQPYLCTSTSSARVSASPLSLRVAAREMGPPPSCVGHGDAFQLVNGGDISPSRRVARRRALRIERPERRSSTSFSLQVQTENKNGPLMRNLNFFLRREDSNRPDQDASNVFACCLDQTEESTFWKDLWSDVASSVFYCEF
jgi:hypothetical protein